MSARSRWIIVFLALVGLGFATSSAWVHYKLLTDASFVSPCDLGSRFNCSDVYLSQYGSVRGVPVALFGIAWFGVVAMIAWFSTPARDKKTPAPGGTYLFAISTVGLAVVLYLGYISWAVLKTYCVLCLGTYAAVVGIFVTSGVASPMSVKQLFGRFGSDLSAAVRKPVVLALTLALLTGTAYAAVVFPRENAALPLQPQAQIQDATALSADQSKAFADAWAQQPRVDLGVPAEGARVVVVKFNDYQCGACAATHVWYKPILEKFDKSNPGSVKYLVKDWPWAMKCNSSLTPEMGAPEHPASCEGAAAVRMARLQGKAKELEMQDLLFENLRSMTPEGVKTAAEKILGIKDFTTEYAKQLPEIRKDVIQGVALKINSTPTIFINGVRIDGQQMMPAAYFDLAIQLELKRAGK